MRKITALAVLLGCAVIAAGAVIECNAQRRDYLAENEKIVQTLPVFPGATRVEKRVEALHERGCEEDCATVGWATHITYRLPAGATAAEVVDLYRGMTDAGWTLEVEEIKFGQAVRRGEPAKPPQPSGDYILRLQRGTAEVSVSTCMTAFCASQTIAVRVDYRGTMH